MIVRETTREALAICYNLEQDCFLGAFTDGGIRQFNAHNLHTDFTLHDVNVFNNGPCTCIRMKPITKQNPDRHMLTAACTSWKVRVANLLKNWTIKIPVASSKAGTCSIRRSCSQSMRRGKCTIWLSIRGCPSSSLLGRMVRSTSTIWRVSIKRGSSNLGESTEWGWYKFM